MALKLNTTRRSSLPSTSRLYAQLGLPTQRLPKTNSDLRDALNSYQWHLQNRKNISQKRI